MSTTLRKVSFATILQATIPRIASYAGLPPELVFLARWRHIPAITSTADVVLLPQAPHPDAPQIDATGNVVAVFRRVVGALVRVRLGTDTGERSTQWFLDPKAGYLQLEDLVLGALSDWMPTDPQGNNLLWESIHVAPIPDQIEAGLFPPDPQWGEVGLWFEFAYMPNVPDIPSNL